MTADNYGVDRHPWRTALDEKNDVRMLVILLDQDCGRIDAELS